MQLAITIRKACVSMLSVVLLSLALVTTTPALSIESLPYSARQATAAIDFRIVIPAILRILEDSHPQSLNPTGVASSDVSALQKIVLVSTLRRGFCMDLRLDPSQFTNWRLSVSGNGQPWVEPSGGGYRLCTARPGRYNLSLQHDFVVVNPAEAGWPVQVSLTTP